LLANGTKACEELGLDVPALKLVAVENTPQTHNAIVCTLCSCYPRMLLGIPPDWYKSRNYRSRMVREPRQVLQEFGLKLADDVQIRVHDSTADMRYLVLPMRPGGTDGWSEERLAALVNRDCMIGVAVPKGPND
jgi:nitrile hydratase